MFPRRVQCLAPGHERPPCYFLLTFHFWDESFTPKKTYDLVSFLYPVSRAQKPVFHFVRLLTLYLRATRLSVASTSFGSEHAVSLQIFQVLGQQHHSRYQYMRGIHVR